MTRDTLKDKEYFDTVIESIIASNNRRFIKLKNGKIKLERISLVKKDMFKNYLRLISAKYSRGDSLLTNEILADFTYAVNFLSESWVENHNGLVQSKSNYPKYLRQYSLTEYIYLLDALSLGIILEVSDGIFELIVDYIDKDGVKDYLLEFLISYRNKSRLDSNTESYEEFFEINESFCELKKVIISNDTNENEKSLKLFLDNYWYSIIKKNHIYGLHESVHVTYSGYWCFVVATIVRIKSLNDFNFKENSYYPKDLA